MRFSTTICCLPRLLVKLCQPQISAVAYLFHSTINKSFKCKCPLVINCIWNCPLYIYYTQFIPSETTLVPTYFCSEKRSLISSMTKFPPADTFGSSVSIQYEQKNHSSCLVSGIQSSWDQIPFHHKLQNGKERMKGESNNHCFPLFCMWEEKVVTEL